MNPITRIYVAGYRYDAEFTRCCVASIREWHRNIPIFLIKDRFYGDYYTKDIERYWNVQIYDVSEKVFGWGFSKLEPLFEKTLERFLVLDSDIIVILLVVWKSMMVNLSSGGMSRKVLFRLNSILTQWLWLF